MPEIELTARRSAGRRALRRGLVALVGGVVVSGSLVAVVLPLFDGVDSARTLVAPEFPVVKVDPETRDRADGSDSKSSRETSRPNGPAASLSAGTVPVGATPTSATPGPTAVPTVGPTPGSTAVGTIDGPIDGPSSPAEVPDEGPEGPSTGTPSDTDDSDDDSHLITAVLSPVQRLVLAALDRAAPPTTPVVGGLFSTTNGLLDTLEDELLQLPVRQGSSRR